MGITASAHTTLRAMAHGLRRTALVTMRSPRIAVDGGVSRRRSAWPWSLALCLAARAADAVDLAEVPYRDALSLRFQYMGDARWRDDDPDLVRAGVAAQWRDAVAEGATIDQVQVIDLDGDGVDEAVARVTPSRDPSPQNEHAGFVVFHRDDGAWRASVLFRPHTDPDPEERRQAPTATLSFHGRGRGLRAVLTVEVRVVSENPSGHGHGEFPERLMLRLAWRPERVVTEGLCAYGYTGPWRGARVVDDREPVGHYLADAPVPAWCRAEARTRAHALSTERE